MPSRLIQSDKHASGEASFQVLGPAVKSIRSLEGIRVSIVQPGATEQYLDPNNPDEPWTTAVSRFVPVQARLEGSVLWLDVDIGVIFHLHANKPYGLQIIQSGETDIHEVFTVPATLRRPAKLPEGWKPPAQPSGPIKAAEPVDTPVEVVPDPLPEVPVILEPLDKEGDQAQDDTDATKPKSSKRWLVWVLLAVLLAAGAAAYMLWNDSKEVVPEPEPKTEPETQPKPEPEPVAQAEPSLASVREFLAASPVAGDARVKADGLSADGKLPDAQFLLYKYAAEKGDAQAARSMGEFYDPNTWEQGKSPMPAPNVEQAERWLKQAAEAGDAQAQYRYGMLLKQGRTDAPDGPEQAVVWLNKAAEQGHAQAKQALNP